MGDKQGGGVGLPPTGLLYQGASSTGAGWGDGDEYSGDTLGDGSGPGEFGDASGGGRFPRSQHGSGGPN